MLILVTGSTDGIGQQTALDLLRRGASVILHGRTDAKAQKAAKEARALSKAPESRVHTCAFDLSSLAEVRAGARSLLAAHPALDVLILNAGVFLNQRRVSADGLELTFAVNHLAQFLLTRELLPALHAGAAARGKPARVVVVASQAHARGPVDFSDLQSERAFSGYGAYALTKALNILFANQLATRSDPKQLVANSLHPGVVGTKLLKSGFNMKGPDSLEEGAATAVYLALSPDVEGVTGRYFVDSKEREPAPSTRDPVAARKLWELSERLCGAG